MGYNCTGIGKDEKPSKENKWAVGGGGTSQSQVHATRQKLKTTNSKVICQGFKKIYKNIPLPGIEPGSPGWKPDILTAGRQRICVLLVQKFNLIAYSISLFFFGGKPTISLLNIDKYWCINWWRYKLVLDDLYL